MRRFAFATACALLAAAPSIAVAQQPQKMQRVAILELTTPQDAGPYTISPLKKALADRGYVEGRNVVYEVRHAGFRLDSLPAMVRQVVATNPDVIVTFGTPTIKAVRRTVTTIPVVMAYCFDPIKEGIVVELARPRANITGICLQGGTAPFVKIVDVAHALVPGNKRIGFLTHGRDDWHGLRAELRRAANSLGATLVEIEAGTREQLERAFADIAAQRVGVLLVPDYAFFLTMRHTIVKLAAEARIPVVYQARYYVDIGGLVSYGPSVREQVTEAADYVARILKGAKPGDLPVQMGKQHELVLNSGTARVMGIRVPEEIMLRVDEIVE